MASRINKEYSFLILNYNSSNLVKSRIKEIRKETQNDIIIVDNSSSNSEKKYLQTLSNKFKNIHLIFSEKNAGYAKGNNLGFNYILERNLSKFVVLCNPDIKFVDGVNKTIKTLIKRFDDKTVIVGPRVVGNKLLHKEQSPKRNNGFFSIFFYNLFYPFSLFFSSLYRIMYVKIIKKPKKVFMVSGAAFVANIHEFKKIGFLPEDTFLTYEENILGIKIRKTEYKCVFDPSVKVFHDHSYSIKKSGIKINFMLDAYSVFVKYITSSPIGIFLLMITGKYRFVIFKNLKKLRAWLSRY